MTTTFTTHFRFGLPDFLSSPWQNDWYTLVQLMDSVLYEISLGTIIDVWANSTLYRVGNLRIDPDLGTIWTCLVQHTSAAYPTTFATDRTNHLTFWGIFTAVDGDKGYITVSGSNSVYTINDGVVSNAKLSNMGQATFKMRAAGAGTGVPIDGTVAQAKTALAYAITDLAVGTSANLAAILSDETGTGAAVFGTAPVLTSPTITTKISPTTDDGAPLGDGTHQFSDLFLASGGIINWNNGDVLISHAANAISFTGATNGYFYDVAIKPTTNDAAPLGVSGTAWSDIFLASGGVINFNAGDVTITHFADGLTFAGATNGYFFQNGPVNPAVDDGAALGTASNKWSDLLLADGGVINWNSGNTTITHAANQLAFVSGNFIFNTTTGTFGYGTGVGTGGTVTQGAGSGKATTVVLNRATGEITLNNAALAAATIVTFAFTNSTMSATDVLVLNHESGGTPGAYTINGRCNAGGGFIDVRNNTAGSLSEAIVIRYTLIRGAVS